MKLLEIELTDRDATRFWSRVQIGGNTDCWTWKGAVDRQGYGRFAKGETGLRAHRVALALAGVDLTGLVVDHLCRVPSCVNPAHLEATTVRVNTARGTSPAAVAIAARDRGICINGHEVGSSGRCPECLRDASRRYLARRRASA